MKSDIAYSYYFDGYMYKNIWSIRKLIQLDTIKNKITKICQ